MPLCTTGDVDISIDPNSVAVADATGFAIGNTISFANAVGAGQDLITTIAGIAGNVITLTGSASATVTGEQFCLVTASGGNWFGPDGPCICDCLCTCENARDDFAHTNLDFTGGAASATWHDVMGSSTYAFPGVGNLNQTIDTSQCVFAAADSITTTDSNPGWDTTDPSSGGYFFASPFGGGSLVSWAASIAYRCVDGVHDYTLTAAVSYVVANVLGNFNHEDHPTWTWEVLYNPTFGFAYDWIGTKTVGSELHRFAMRFSPTTPNSWGISYQVSVDSSAATVSLGAPPYDPMGLLVGTATVS